MRRTENFTFAVPSEERCAACHLDNCRRLVAANIGSLTHQEVMETALWLCVKDAATQETLPHRDSWQ